MSQLEALLQQCTVKLTLPGRMGWGTGFFVAPGWILTCAHVVQGAKGEPVQVWWQKRELAAVVERSLPTPYDLALLQVACPSDVNPPCVYLDEEIRSRDPLYLFGYPDEGDHQGEPRTFYCDGTTGSEIPSILFNLGQVRPGMSGSPLLNQRTGKVCGIVKFTRDRSFDLGGGAVPAAVILAQFPELVEQQRSFHQHDQRWSQRLEGAIATNHISSPSTRATLSLSTYDAATWVGRDSLVTSLTQKLKGDCRILVLTGITGIGKTALAERLVVEVSGSGMPFHRLNFDDRGQGRDFLSGALALLPKLDETVTPEDQHDPQNALTHLLEKLRTNRFLIQIDSVEMLLQGDEQTGWNAFADKLWRNFFRQLLAGENCQSQLLLTSQALPEELAEGARYARCWHHQHLGGLSEAEQLQLFEKQGLEPDKAASETLKRLGKLYEGHPLAIAVIARDILDKPFNGNVQQYWQRYQSEFDAIDHDRKKGSSPRSLQLRVKQRVEQSLKRLPVDAYKMLCRSAVYRRPVPEDFWLTMLDDRSEDEQLAALDLLKTHNLAEQELRTDGVLLLRQHNLVRSVARRLLKTDAAEWQEAERTAAQTWLSDYEPELDALNLEQVRGELEAFHHYREVEDWEQAEEIPFRQLDTPDREVVHQQLGIWGYYQEQIRLYSALLQVFRKTNNRRDEGFSLGNLGSAYSALGNYQQALNYYQQHLEVVRELNHRNDEGFVLNNLARIYQALDAYQQATEYYQQALSIVQETGNRLNEGIILGNLGSLSSALGNYEQALVYHQQALAMVRKAEDRQSEQAVLGNLGEVSYLLGSYEQALEYHQQALTMAQKIGNRRGEEQILGNLGLVHHAWGNYAQALAYHQQGLTIAREIGDQQGQSAALGDVGFALCFLGTYDQAMESLQQSLTIAREIGDRQGEATTLGNIGRVFCGLSEYQQALDHHQQRLTIAREIGDRRGEGIAQMQLGATFIKLEHYSEAQPLLQSALDLCRKAGNRAEEAETLLLLAELHEHTGQFQLAQQFCKESLRIAALLRLPLLNVGLELLERVENDDL